MSKFIIVIFIVLLAVFCVWQLKKPRKHVIIVLGTQLNISTRGFFVLRKFITTFIVKHRAQDCNPKFIVKGVKHYGYINILAKNNITLPVIGARESDVELKDVSQTGKERNWAVRKQQNLQIYKLYKKAREIQPSIISVKRLQELRDCGTELAFMVNAQGQKKLYSANFCRVRFCNICAWRRSLKLYAQVSKCTSYLLAQQPSTRFIFATLTIKNSKNLAVALDTLNKGFKNMVLRTKSPLLTTKLGYIKALEVTYNTSTGEYHPHLHVVFALKSSFFGRHYLTQKQWQALWKQAAGLDYMPVIHVRAVQTTARAVAELAKYPAKPQELISMPPVDFIKLVQATSKRRFVSFGGCFKAIKAQLRLQDLESRQADLVGVSVADVQAFNPVAVLLYKYNVQFGIYLRG